jgi:HPt (histidine-containing phosphotransfer) domain-containing protein
LPVYCNEINKAYQSGDNKLFLRAIHKFHSGLCYVGVPRLRASAKKLHEALLNNSQDPIDELYKILLDEVKVFEQAAKALNHGVI